LSQPCSADTASKDGVRLDYTLKEPGFVSAAVYDSQGAMVRPLLYAEKQEAGNHRLVWDGLDSYGQPQPIGKYPPDPIS
jgi:flagellar hook assembly protein FlgD